MGDVFDWGWVEKKMAVGFVGLGYAGVTCIVFLWVWIGVVGFGKIDVVV